MAFPNMRQCLREKLREGLDLSPDHASRAMWVTERANAEECEIPTIPGRPL